MITQPEYIEGNGFIAEVIRTSRIKTADVRVEDGAVSVVVPKELPQDRICTILKDKNKWIKHKIILHREAMPISAKEYVSGESFSYLGRNYRLKVSRGHFKPVKPVQGRLVATVPQGIDQPHMVRNALVRWYKCHSETKIQEKLSRYAKLPGVEPKSLAIRDFKSRWGSSHKSGDILINWKIVMAPNRIVDYVVAHELCHLKFYDHSPKFWKELGKVVPHYVECREWLRAIGRSLEL